MSADELVAEIERIAAKARYFHGGELRQRPESNDDLYRIAAMIFRWRVLAGNEEKKS